MNILKSLVLLGLTTVKSSHWGYHDTKNWIINYTECAGVVGKVKTQQSPINFDTSKLNNSCTTETDLAVRQWDITKGPTKFDIKNNGHSIEITNPSDKNWQSRITYENGDVYCFNDFHLHWSQLSDNKGSEHSIDGTFFPLEAHMVHYYCFDSNGTETYASKAAAAKAYQSNVFVNSNKFLFSVVDLFYDVNDEAEDHLGLQTLLAKSSYLGDENTNNIEIDLSAFVPASYLHSTADYYTYKGSLTTPPCLSTVIFIAFTNHSKINPKQLHAFETASGLTENHRPPQQQQSFTQVYQCSTKVKVN